MLITPFVVFSVREKRCYVCKKTKTVILLQPERKSDAPGGM